MSFPSVRREIVSVIIKLTSFVLAVFIFISIVEVWLQDEALSDGTCNIAVISIEGIILPFESYTDYPLVTTPRMIRNFIERAEADPYIQGLVFEINSPGGTPVAAADIAAMIRDSKLPSVSIIGDIGASGGYLAAAGAGHVVASPMSDVGSIGVTMSYLDYSKKNEDEGVSFIEINSAPYKDVGNPNRPLSDEERELLTQNIALIHEEFVTQIATYRDIERDQISELTNGLTIPGRKALEVGLVDSLGGRGVALEALSAKLNLDQSDLAYCKT